MKKNTQAHLLLGVVIFSSITHSMVLCGATSNSIVQMEQTTSPDQTAVNPADTALSETTDLASLDTSSVEPDASTDNSDNTSATDETDSTGNAATENLTGANENLAGIHLTTPDDTDTSTETTTPESSVSNSDTTNETRSVSADQTTPVVSATPDTTGKGGS